MTQNLELGNWLVTPCLAKPAATRPAFLDLTVQRFPPNPCYPSAFNGSCFAEACRRFHQNLSKQKIQDSNHFPNNCYYTQCGKQQKNGNGKSFIKRIMRKFSEVSSKAKITKTFRYLQSNLLRKPKKRTRCNIKQPDLGHQALSSISPKVQRTPHRNRQA